MGTKTNPEQPSLIDETWEYTINLIIQQYAAVKPSDGVSFLMCHNSNEIFFDLHCCPCKGWAEFPQNLWTRWFGVGFDTEWNAKVIMHLDAFEGLCGWLQPPANEPPGFRLRLIWFSGIALPNMGLVLSYWTISICKSSKGICRVRHLRRVGKQDALARQLGTQTKRVARLALICTIENLAEHLGNKV